MKKILLILLLAFTMIQVVGYWSISDAAIALQEPKNLRVYQRNATTESLDILIGGTYSSPPDPATIEYRIVEDGTSVEVVTWTTLSSATIADGVFLGTAEGVPQGGWYNMQVRFANETSTTSEGVNPFGVGIVVGCIGQSNMARWLTFGTGTSSDLLVINNSGTYSVSNSGIGRVTFGNALVSAFGVPVSIIHNAVGATSLTEEADGGTGWWMDYTGVDSTLYTDFIARVNSSGVGGYLEFILWAQGERDAQFGISEADYETALYDATDANSFIRRLRTDTGNRSSETNLPFLFSTLGREVGGAESTWQGVRNAQVDTAEVAPDTYVAASAVDLLTSDNIHYTNASQEILGNRLAQTVSHILDPVTYPNYRGILVDSALAVDTTTTDVFLLLNGGTNFSPTTGIKGFEVAEGDVWEDATTAVQNTATSVRLTHSAMTGVRKVRVLYGVDPDVTSVIFNNATLSLPIESTREMVVSIATLKDSSGGAVYLKDSSGNTVYLKDSNGNTLE